MIRLAVLLLLSTQAFAADPAKFFANASFHENNPGATVLTSKSFVFVEKAYAITLHDGDKLIAAINAHSELASDVSHFPTLSTEKKMEVMKAVFELEVQASQALAPTLVLDTAAKKETFFDFDPKKAGPGKVILNPTKLFADSNPYAGLLFLIHETRHSYQFQVGFSALQNSSTAFANAYQTGIHFSESNF